MMVMKVGLSRAAGDRKEDGGRSLRTNRFSVARANDEARKAGARTRSVCTDFPFRARRTDQ